MALAATELDAERSDLLAMLAGTGNSCGTPPAT